MKQSFTEKRIKKIDITINKKDLFELTIIEPTKKTNRLVIYLPGLNGNGSLVKYFNYNFFDNYYLVSFDQRAQGNNENKPSRRYKKYLNDLNKIIQKIKSIYPNIKSIFLIGESWGSSLAFLFNKYYPNVIKATIGWNMPYEIIDVSTVKGIEKIKNNFKMIGTFLFNINTYDTSEFNTKLTNNPVLIRIIKTIKRKKLNNKVIIAAWLSFKKSWKFLIKQANHLNLMYIQSENDILKTSKALNKLISTSKNVLILDNGYHILTFDDNANDKLFNEINLFLKQY